MNLLTSSDIRIMNKKAILELLYLNRQSTIRNLEKLSGLSFAAIKSNLEELIRDDYVEECELIPSGGGRPARSYGFKSKNRTFLQISIHRNSGNVEYSLSLSDLYGNVIDKKEITDERFSLDTLKSLILSINKNSKKIIGISIAAPGVPRDGVYINNDIDELIGIDLVGEVFSLTKIKVILVNDVNAAIFSISKESDLWGTVGIYFPMLHNPGAGAIIGGQIIQGVSGFAGEVGTIPLGINWITIDYNDRDVLAGAIIKLLIVYRLTIDPNEYILYGNMFDEELIKKITTKLSTSYDNHQFKIFFRNEIKQDIISGLFKISLTDYLKLR
ncbi:ROK family transcriptional regulator [Erysipelothrix anatis]|uniref:ROK family transcriptional regulator n=1 Tax=Erysipelothrix anatis TaxID=2683713 RepID=UPI0014083F73|nr:ROK family protein [Erysipelothrix anatis]